jgi:hypothetical protein
MPVFTIPNSSPGESQEIFVLEKWTPEARAAAAAARRGQHADIPVKKFDNLLRKGHERVDLTKVKVGGKALFSSRFKNLRIHMPQFSKDLKKKFFDKLKRQGIDVSKKKVPAVHLKPSQRQFSFPRASEVFGTKGSKDKRIMVSKDNHIIDGHHHWVSAIGRDSRAGKLGSTKIKTYKVDMSAAKLLAMAKRYTKAQGGVSKGV